MLVVIIVFGQKLVLKSPDFWNSKESWCTKALYPISRIYRLIKSIQFNRVDAEKVNIPVICVGDIVVNGAGKTITVELVCNMLKEAGYNPHILSVKNSGYLRNVVRVDTERHSYLQVGGEALLSGGICPTWVGKDKLAAADAAILSGADVIVMDGGFQNNELVKDFKILVVDSLQGFGNEHIFPAGFLKEDVSSGVKKANVILLIGPKNQELEDIITDVNRDAVIFYAEIKALQNEDLKKEDKVIAFCGIGSPQKFKRTLLEMELDILDFISFPNHHPYTITESQRMVKAARNAGAKLVTTKKDYIKIPDSFKSEISVIGVKLSFTQDSFKDIITKLLDGWSSG